MKIRQFHKYIDRKLFKYGIKNAHVIIAQTGYQAKRAFGINKKAAIEIVRNFHPSPKNISNIDKKKKITWVANFKRLKQPEIFIALSKKLLEKKLDIQCVMIGSPASHREKYQKMLEVEINNTPILKWFGKQPLEVVNKHLEESMLFVNTSKWEGFPNTYIQAWMRKTPVVALSCDPDNQISEFGLGLRSGSFEQMIEDVIFLIKSDDKRIAMGERSKRFALENYSFKNLEKLSNIILNCHRKDCAL
jgi:glycosyltransferase involved in cell wall biosynthesis